MKVTGSIVLYCGMPDPEMEFDEATAKEIAEKLFGLDQRCDKIPLYRLGFRGYSVVWNPEIENAPWVQVRAHDGIVELNCFGVRSAYVDNIGLVDYLKAKLADCLQQHIDEGTKDIEDYQLHLFKDDI